jgi:hypothetical protein
MTRGFLFLFLLVSSAAQADVRPSRYPEGRPWRSPSTEYYDRYRKPQKPAEPDSTKPDSTGDEDDESTEETPFIPFVLVGAVALLFAWSRLPKVQLTQVQEEA